MSTYIFSRGMKVNRVMKQPLMDLDFDLELYVHINKNVYISGIQTTNISKKKLGIKIKVHQMLLQFFTKQVYSVCLLCNCTRPKISFFLDPIQDMSSSDFLPTKQAR